MKRRASGRRVAGVRPVQHPAAGIRSGNPGWGGRRATGRHLILENLVSNLTGFAPLGTVLVALLGIGIADHSGMIGTGLRLLVLKAPPRLLTAVVVFAGVLSNTASEVNPACNYLFMAVSTFVVTGVVTWVTERIVEPRLPAWTGDARGLDVARTAVRSGSRRALAGAGPPATTPGRRYRTFATCCQSAATARASSRRSSLPLSVRGNEARNRKRFGIA